jgi:hypothetical protein
VCPRLVAPSCLLDVPLQRLDVSLRHQVSRPAGRAGADMSGASVSPWWPPEG